MRTITSGSLRIVWRCALAIALLPSGASAAFFAGSSSSARPTTPGQDIATFGTTSFGGINVTGGFDSAATAWFQDQFGMFVRGSMNSTEMAQGGGGYVRGYVEETLNIAPQQGNLQGSAGILRLTYHLDGVVNIDVGDTFSGSTLVSFGAADLFWGFTKQELGTDANRVFINTFERSWRSNHLVDVVDVEISFDVPFHFGKPFNYGYDFTLGATASSPIAPSVGYAEADFMNTGSFVGGAVYNSMGDRLINPTVSSDSGFEYVIVPEPAPMLPALVGGVLIALTQRRRRESRGLGHHV